jgi:hypothetical protein
MQFLYLLPILVSIFMPTIAFGCLMQVPDPNESDLKHPPLKAIAFKGTITKVVSHGDLNRGNPHSDFQLKLKVTKAYRGVKVGSTIVINYGACHSLPGKSGSQINVLALHRQDRWYAPQFWSRSK